MKNFLLPFILFLSTAQAQEKITYEDHIKPIFRQHCLKCHGNDKQKADLNLQSYGSALKGGSGGEALIAGRSSQSLLYQALIDEDEDARMPPNKPPIPQEQIDLVQKWIDTGMLETASGKAMIETRDLSFQPSGESGSKPETPAMPENLPGIELAATKRPLPVLAVDTSPWAPLLAIAGQEHIKLINTETQETLGHLPFPEGIPHAIRFSRNGAVLMAAGGHPVQNGSVVLYDVKTGKRLAEIGDELDAVLAADLSPNQEMVALGGSGKVVRVYATSTGELLYELKKHTDWITSISFSPDGTRLATADRAGGLHLWQSDRGGLLLNLAEHTASITALDWRLDSRILASTGDDGKIIWWDVKDGFPAINKPNDHPTPRPPGEYGKMPNGVLAAHFGRTGNLVTAGRNGVVQLYDSGGKVLKQFRSEESTPISVAITFDDKFIVAGYANGEVRFWSAEP